MDKIKFDKEIREVLTKHNLLTKESRPERIIIILRETEEPEIDIRI